MSTLRSRRRRRHLAVVTNCSTVLFPSRPGIRRIAFQQLLNTPAEEEARGEGADNREPRAHFLSNPPFLPSASSFWRRTLVVDVSWSSVFFESASRRGRAYLNEPTIEITNGDFCQRVFSRRYTRARFLRREAWTILLLIYITPEYIGGRKKRDGGVCFLHPPFAFHLFFFPSSFLLFSCYHRADVGRNRLKQLDFQAFGSRPSNGSEPGAARASVCDD